MKEFGTVCVSSLVFYALIPNIIMVFIAAGENG